MGEVPQGEHATFSFLDLITLGLILEAIPDFTHGKVLDGIVCFWLAYVNHAIGVRWQISRYLIPPAALTLFVYAFRYCIGIEGAEMRYLAAGILGAGILIAAVAAYSWINHSQPPTATKNPPSSPAPASGSAKSESSATVSSQTPRNQQSSELQAKKTHKQQSSKTQPTGPDMKMLADVMAGKPVPAPSAPSKAKISVPVGPPPPGKYRCPDGRFVPEHHAEQCGASNITMRYNTFDAGSPPNPPIPVPNKEECGLRNSTTSNNIYRNGALPDLSGQCDSQFNNNLTENKAQGKDRPKLTIGGKQNDIGHNTFPKMDIETTDTSQGNKLHDNSFQDSATPEQAPTTKDGNGADATAILKAQTRNQYPGGYPDVPWPVATTVLHGTNSGVADQLAQLIDAARKIVANFMKDDNAQLIDETEKTWEVEAHSVVVTNLGPRFGQEFDEAESTSTAYPQGHNARGGSICNLIDAKIAVLATFVNQLRAASH